MHQFIPLVRQLLDNRHDLQALSTRLDSASFDELIDAFADVAVSLATASRARAEVDVTVHLRAVQLLQARLDFKFEQAQAIDAFVETARG